MPRDPNQNRVPRDWQARKAARDKGAKATPARWSSVDWAVVEAECDRLREAQLRPHPTMALDFVIAYSPYRADAVPSR